MQGIDLDYINNRFKILEEQLFLLHNNIEVLKKVIEGLEELTIPELLEEIENKPEGELKEDKNGEEKRRSQPKPISE